MVRLVQRGLTFVVLLANMYAARRLLAVAR
jgi:hypothetical protein